MAPKLQACFASLENECLRLINLPARMQLRHFLVGVRPPMCGDPSANQVEGGASSTAENVRSPDHCKSSSFLLHGAAEGGWVEGWKGGRGYK